MNKKEISEIKKQFTPEHCALTRMCGCYVDGEKNKKALFGQAFLALPEEEMFKYFEILRKALSGTLGKNLLNLEFPLSGEWIEDAAADTADAGDAGDAPDRETPGAGNDQWLVSPVTFVPPLYQYILQAGGCKLQSL